MEGTNHILLSGESVREALQQYLNNHLMPGLKVEVVSWGIQCFSGQEWCDVEFKQASAPAAGGES